MENCWTLKNKVQDLVDDGTIIPVDHGVNAIIFDKDEFNPFELFLKMSNQDVTAILDVDKVEDFTSLSKPAEDRLTNWSLEEECFVTTITYPSPRL